jgi:hypothetical protein
MEGDGLEAARRVLAGEDGLVVEHRAPLARLRRAAVAERHLDRVRSRREARGPVHDRRATLTRLRRAGAEVLLLHARAQRPGRDARVHLGDHVEEPAAGDDGVRRRLVHAQGLAGGGGRHADSSEPQQQRRHQRAHFRPWKSFRNAQR